MSDNNTTIIKTAFYKASRETVWSFLTNKEKLAQWYHPAENDLQDGADYSLITRSDNGETSSLIWGRVLEMVEPSRLVYTFCISAFEGSETVVTWQLDEAAGGTRLTLKHEGIAEAAGDGAMGLLMALDHGWDQHVDRMRSAVSSLDA